MPIFGILCDAVTFEFYKLDGNLGTPKFSKGRLSMGLQEPLVAFPLARLDMKTPVQPFIRSLRLVTEIIFDVLLMAYSSSLIAYKDRSQAKTAQSGKPRESLGGWEEAIQYVNLAQQMFRDGEKKRKDGRIVEANTDALEAMRILTLRYNFSIIGCLVTQNYIQLSSTNEVPAIYRLPSLMNSWNDADIESM